MKQETPDSLVYGKEGKLTIKDLSNDGKWVSYVIAYENGNDTLFLQNTATRLQLKFPDGTQPTFGSSRFFVYRDKQDLNIRNLESGKTVILPGIKRYEFLEEGKSFVTLSKGNVLQLRNDDNKVITAIEDLGSYEINEAKNAILYSRKNSGSYEIGILTATNTIRTELAVSDKSFSKLNWRADGKAVSYMNGRDLVYFDLTLKKSYALESADLLKYGKVFSDSFQFPIAISDDGQKVFFGASLAEKREVVKGVEVWNGNDTKLYSAQQVTAVNGIPIVCVWYPKKDVFRVLSDEVRYSARLTGLNDYVLLADPFQHGTDPSYPETVDYYIKNVHTGAERLLLSKQSNDTNRIRFSPLSNSIAYYRDKQWWLYNPENDASVYLTKNVATEWDNNTNNSSGTSSPFGLAAWTEDGKSVFIYDEYDIWKVALNGGSCVRITKGRESQKKYRLDKSEFANSKFRVYNGEQRLVLSNRQEFVLYVENQNDWSTGYAVYSSKKGIRTMDYGPQYRSELRKSRTNSFVFLTETFENAPQLNFLNAINSKVTILHTPKQQTLSKRKAELIRYTNSKGTELKAALFYPDNYDSSKNYPMIVRVYEKMSKDFHKYSRMTLRSYEGDELANFTASGYFVLYPDFDFELGNPGLSATDCVLAAVKKALSSASINPKKVGLIGHSYGGYETNFIITQTDVFAAAVSGAGVSDPVGRYFGLAFNLYHNDMWRYESQQFRMGTSFFSNKKGYLNNSPIMNADKIKTPLLLWHGKQDDTIPFDQSVSLYLALRRLHLPTILLAYPDEGHAVKKPENQEDLTKRVLQWFDYFLKDKTDAGWVTNGINSE